MSHITVITDVERVKATDKPQVDDYNRKNDLITNTQNINDTSRIGHSQNVPLANDFHSNTQNVPLTNDYPNTQRRDFDDTHTHVDNNLPNKHVIIAPLVKNDVEKTNWGSNDVGRTHLESNDAGRTHLESNDIKRPIVNDVGKTNIVSYENVETDLNRKDNWRTPDETKPTNVSEDYHKRANITPDETTHLKTDSHHHHHHHNRDHDLNKKDDVYVRDSNKNDNVLIPDSNKNVHVDVNKRNVVTREHEDFNQRNLTYDTNPSTFANDVGTTGLLGNNLGNNLATDVGPAHLQPTGINKNADWTGHVPDINHPTELEAKDLKKK